MSDNRKHAATEGGNEPPTAESWLGRHGPWVLLLVYLHYCLQIAMEIFGGRVGLPCMVALNAWFSVSQDFWWDTEARQLLRH